MALFGTFKFGQCLFGPSDCPENAYMIRNISKQTIRIFVEGETDLIEGEWMGIQPGRHITVEKSRINEGWIENLYASGLIKLDGVFI